MLKHMSVMVEAVQWTGDNFHDVGTFCPDVYGPYADLSIRLKNGEAAVHVYPNNWIVRDLEGNYLVMSDAQFRTAYERIDGEPQ